MNLTDIGPLAHGRTIIHGQRHVKTHLDAEVVARHLFVDCEFENCVIDLAGAALLAVETIFTACTFLTSDASNHATLQEQHPGCATYAIDELLTRTPDTIPSSWVK